MMPTATKIAQILQDCEENGDAREYDETGSAVSLDSEDRDVLLVSDLHLGPGLEHDGTYAGTENFFADRAFARFLSSFSGNEDGKGMILILNGDMIDFLRIAHIPDEDTEFNRWAKVLSSLGVEATPDELKKSIRKESREGYGLKTQDYKSVWRLEVAAKGHPALFDALAQWLADGNQLVIVKGNHDLEWYWRLVRNYLRLLLAQKITELSGHDATRSVEQELMEAVLGNLVFVDHSLIVGEILYVEHGHQFDPYTSVDEDGPVWDRSDVAQVTTLDPRELRLPFGSFFNRYVINKIELVYPYYDNIRPIQNLVPLLIREHFFLAMRVLFQHIPRVIRILRKRKVRRFRYLTRLLVHILLLTIPVGILFGEIVRLFEGVDLTGFIGDREFGVATFLLDQAGGLARSFVWLATGYFLSRLAAFLQLLPEHGFEKRARSQFALNPALRMITYGHIHKPEQAKIGGNWYYNTSTWIPVFEISSAAVRLDQTYTFLHLKNDPEKGLEAAVLERWNDDAGRAEVLPIVRRKDAD